MENGVEKNVQRLESEDFLPILFPRAPCNSHTHFLLKKPLPTVQVYKQTLVLSQKLIDIAVGGLLGDVTIQTQNKGKTYRLKFQQSDKHRDYLFHLHDVFHEWVLSPPHYHPDRDMWSFQTIGHGDFGKLANLFTVDRTLQKACETIFS